MKTLIVLALLLSLSHCAYADLVLGTNCGFVTAAPVDDPAGLATDMSSNVKALRVTVPTGYVYEINRLGWYCSSATDTANYEMGIYTDDGSEPDVLLVKSGPEAKGAAAAWITKEEDLSYMLNAGIYWIAVQCDWRPGTNADYKADAGEKMDYKLSYTTLPDPWGNSTDTLGWLLSVYALYTSHLVTNMQGCTLQGATINQEMPMTDLERELQIMEAELEALKRDIEEIKKEIEDERRREGQAN